MAKIRDRDRTRKRIIDAGAREFSEKGYDAATLSGIARRARVSKQLIHHHFGGKDKLFQEVHDERFRPTADNRDMLPDDPSQLFAARFEKRAGDLEYIRFLTWEAAAGRRHHVPHHEARQRRIAEYGEAIAALQREGRLPVTLDARLLHLAILALATYPMAFAQITQLVTGRAPTDPAFQKVWIDFLGKLGDSVLKRSPTRKTAGKRSRD